MIGKTGNQRCKPHSLGLLTALVMLMVATNLAWPQASWVGDVIVDGEPSNLWADCLPCTAIDEPPNTNWSTDRIPGDDGPLGDPGTGAVIGPDYTVDHNGGTLDLSTLDVQGGLIVGGLINISGSATINNINLQSGGALAGPGPVTLTGSGTWDGFLRSGGGVTNDATLTVATGDLQAALVNNATLNINPSLNFTSTPSTLTNNGLILLDTDTALFNNSDILDGSSAANLLLNQGSISKFGADLSVIEAPGNHAGGLIAASDGTLRFFRGDWQFSGGGMRVANNGQIELTGNVDHVINGTPGISGQGNFLVNMSTFGTLTVTQPFVVDLTGDPGLILQGIGINLEAALTNRQGGRWSQGVITGAGAGRLINESPLSDPFRIVSGGSKTLNRDLGSTGWISQSDTVTINAPHRLLIGPSGGLAILADPTSVDWVGNGEILSSGMIEILPGARSTISAAFSQANAGILVSQGELTLRGGGMWSGSTLTELAGETASVPTISMESSQFDFVSGSHSFSDMDSAPGFEVLNLSNVELNAGPGATVIFDLDEGILIDGPGKAGHVVLSTGSLLRGEGRFENRGNFLWQGGQFGWFGTFRFLNVSGSELMIQSAVNVLSGLITNQGSVHGGLWMLSNATINNESFWTLMPGDSIHVSDPANPGTFNNAGNLAVTNVANTRIDARLNNTGVVTVFASSTLQLNGPVDQLQDGMLSGGTWAIGNSARLIFPESFDTIGPGTAVRGLQLIDESQALSRILGGSAIVTGDFTTNGDLLIDGGGRITFEGQSSTTVPGGVINGGASDHASVLEFLEEANVINAVPTPPRQRMTARAGAGKFTQVRGPATTPLLTTPMLDNHAILAPGGIGLPGPFNLDGELVMHPGATLDIDLAGTTPVAGHDQLVVSGPITLDGTVQISVAEGFFPAVGQPFVIATAGQGVVGMLDGVVNANRDDIVWQITETSDQVIVEAVEVERIFGSSFEGF